MKRLVVCCDGTWNTPDQEQNGLPAPTNVLKLYNAVAPRSDGVEQKTYYHPGVGTEGSFFERKAGGMYGAGLSMNIMSAYVWLAENYEHGDQIFLFGFSRGAFTVRSLSGFLARCGLLDLDGLEPAEAYDRVEKAYEDGFRDDKKNWRRVEWALCEPAPTPVHFIGAWDTVGALGIPDEMGFLNLLDKPEKWRFHTDYLEPNVKYARHALAIDEQRSSFTPTLWTDPATKTPCENSDRVKQLWFPGVHGDVGGGYFECGLSDIALGWMIEEAAAKELGFLKKMVDQLKPDPRGVLHNSVQGIFKALRTRPRNIPCFSDKTFFHPSAIYRQKDPPIGQAPYHPTIRLASGKAETFQVHSRERWNNTGLYLERGATYVFTAMGEWLDGKTPCGPGGMRDGTFHPSEIKYAFGSFLGGCENLFKKINGNEHTDFWKTRRVESIPWLTLVGAIANDGRENKGGALNDGSSSPHEMFLVGEGPVKVTIQKPGYFYAFANDGWALYGNNRGHVNVTVTKK